MFQRDSFHHAAGVGTNLQPSWLCAILTAWGSAFGRASNMSSSSGSASRFGCLVLRDVCGPGRTPVPSALVVGAAHLSAFNGHWLPRSFDQQSITGGV
jgi:hypothetical protein